MKVRPNKNPTTTTNTSTTSSNTSAHKDPWDQYLSSNQPTRHISKPKSVSFANSTESSRGDQRKNKIPSNLNKSKLSNQYDDDNDDTNLYENVKDEADDDEEEDNGNEDNNKIMKNIVRETNNGILLILNNIYIYIYIYI